MTQELAPNLMAEPSRKSRRKSLQDTKVLFDWDMESRLSADMGSVSAFRRLKGSDHGSRVRSSIVGCFWETEDHDDCTLQNHKDIVDTIPSECAAVLVRAHTAMSVCCECRPNKMRVVIPQ